MDERNLMRATSEWMAKKYNEMNQLLFNGELGDCLFGIFTTGKGSMGGVLGWFKITAKGIKADRRTRRMYKIDQYDLTKTYIDRSNFVKVCKPAILLNGNYSATEESLTATLVHEMVHYANYMYGYSPRQGHGTEFRKVATIITSRSNGMLTVQRVASAEQMSGYKLDAEIKAKNDARKERKKSNTCAVFVFKKDGRVELTNVKANNYALMRKIYEYYTSGRGKGEAKKMVTSTDPALIDELFENGYKRTMTKHICWWVTDQPFVKNLDNYETDDWSIMSESVNNTLTKKHLQTLIEDAVNSYIDVDDDSVPVSGINLGIKSPFEAA